MRSTVGESPGKQSDDSVVPTRRPHLLVASGVYAVRRGLAGILRRAGYDVDEASDFDETRVVLDKGEVDTLVVASDLPPDGYLSLLDAVEVPPPTVVLSSPTDDVTGIAADPRVQWGLTRPFRLQALYDAVARAVSQKRRTVRNQ
jgi:DNA-binding response OmpR family regulator